MAAVGVAAEAGHAFQDAKGYVPLAIRNLLFPPPIWLKCGDGLAVCWFDFQFQTHRCDRIASFACVVFSGGEPASRIQCQHRAREELVAQGIIAGNEEQYVAQVLNAAALTYVAGTLQAIMTLLYYGMRVLGNQR